MERASSEEPACSSTEARNLILEVARSRPGTHVAKCIEAYEEHRDLASLVTLLEEVSKNTDYSTDLRLSLGYYTKDFLRFCLATSDVSRRTALVAAGRTLQYCGKIYGDRVEYMYQVVEHQIEALLSSQPQREPAGENNGPENAPKPEEPRKRRAKKLTKKEVDPYLITMEPRRFRTMSDEKRFSTNGFVKCSKNRTIEYLYQDHMPPNLWRHAPIVDPQNPLDLDEKKQYKMFTYHVEHRYNTLLPDIPFERLNLIKEYVHTNQMNTSEILNEHMTTKDYLDECIELENKMLASRYGATVRTRRRMNDQGKRLLDESAEASTSKRARLETMEPDEAGLTAAMETDQSTPDNIDQSTSGVALQNQVSRDSGLGDSMNFTPENSAINSTLAMDHSLSVSQVEDSSLSVSQLADSAIGISQGENSCPVENSSLGVGQEENCSLSVSQVEDPPLSSTLLAMNESSTLAINQSSVLESTRLDFPPVTEEELLQIDFGIGMDDVSDSHHTGQSFEDEGVVLSDCEEQRQRRRQFETADAAMTDLNEIKVEEAPPPLPEETPIIVMHAEEPVNVPREVCYPLVLNIFGFPNKHVRRKCCFKLPKEYDTFKKPRLTNKRGAEPRAPATPRVLGLRSDRNPANESNERPALPESVEFDLDMNFLGFRRRPTMDSGFAFDDIPNQSRTDSPDMKIEVDACVNPVNIEKTEGDAAEENVSNEAAPIETPSGEAVISSVATEPSPEEANTANLTENSGTEAGLEATVNSRMDSGLEATMGSELNATDGPQLDQATLEITTLLDEATIIDEAPANAEPDRIDDDSDEETSLDNVDFTDSSEMIRNWHMRLAPTLEAAHARQNFNIKDLGTEILNVCQAGVGGEATLADVMTDKDPSIMCRYMLASLVLTNHGNVSLHFGNRDKSKPMEMSQFCMQLKSTRQLEIHPEDDVGNMSAVAAKAKDKDKSKPAKRTSTDLASPEVFAKTVRLIQPVPKMSQSAYDTDSGISSMCSSLASAPLGD